MRIMYSLTPVKWIYILAIGRNIRRLLNKYSKETV